MYFSIFNVIRIHARMCLIIGAIRLVIHIQLYIFFFNFLYIQINYTWFLQADELDVLIKEETTKRVGLKEELDTTKDLMCEVRTDIEESKKKLNSLMELQSELSNKLEISTTEKMNVESQLEKAVATRAEMVRDIGELRRQRDVLRRRVEFCREKDAIGMAVRMSEPGCSFREYSAEEIRLATDDYSERLRLKSGGDLTHVYRGRISHCTVAIKMINSSSAFSREEFQAQVHKIKLALINC